MAVLQDKDGQWGKGDVYETYVGRWSRLVAGRFLEWIAIPSQASWLDVGCGTGALSQTILRICDPKKVTGIDRSEEFVAFARGHTNDARAHFETGDAQRLPVENDARDAAVSALVLNFVPEPARMIAEMRRAVRTGGRVALYVWDYAGKMEFIRYFWDAASALDAEARDLDENARFPLCQPEPLQELLLNSGLSNVKTLPIVIDTPFKDFADYWLPFEGAQGPAPNYAMSLAPEARARLKQRIRESLPFATDGSIPLIARAWAVQGTK